MKKPVISIIIVALVCSASAAQDMGIPDTIKIVGDTLIVGQSVAVELVIVNDQEVSTFEVPIQLSTLDGGYAIFDSIVWVNRMDDPMVADMRFIADWSDGISPDTVIPAAIRAMGNCLPTGNDAIARLYFTGVSEGNLLADSVLVMLDPYTRRSTLLSYCGEGANWDPAFVSDIWPVVESPEPPIFTVPETVVRTTGGALISFEIDAESPGGSEVTLELLSFAGDGDPVVAPTLSGSLPATFEWQTTSEDIGIWKAEFQACDTEDKCAAASVAFQIVQNESYLVSFTTYATASTDKALGIALGNFDIDPYPELLTAGWPYYYFPCMSLYDIDLEDGEFQKVLGFGEQHWSANGLQTGFVDNDNSLDAVITDARPEGESTIGVWRGKGANDLELLTQSPAPGAYRPALLAELTGDQYLDYAVGAFEELIIFASAADYTFTELTRISVPDLVLTVNSADFNQDGYNDLAIGTSERVQIYLNNGTGTFTAGASYAQTYDATDLEVTNSGSDFNNDGLFDLCVSTPSTGATYSQIYVYLGAGDGSFEQRHVRTLEGYALGNCIADFNNDNELDIAYIDGGESGVVLLYGDGDGNFTNETRFYIEHDFLALIACADVDLDGDFDIVATGRDLGYWLGNATFLLENQLDPVGFAVSSVEAIGLNNVAVELTSSGGKVLNSVKSTMPGAEMHSRNIDDDETIDAFAQLALLESGAYSVTATPRPDLAAGETFSLEFAVNGTQYRLANDIPMSETGYQFEIYPTGGSPVNPAPGVFTSDNPVTFQWTGSGEFNFQLASDIDFIDLLVDVTVSGNSYVSPELTSEDDTATFYWRVQSVGTDASGSTYPVNVLMAAGTDVDDEAAPVPGKFSLSQNYPNPFNPRTRIFFSLPEACRVELVIYNIAGQKICTLTDAYYPAGEHFVDWDSKTGSGEDAASGIYLYQICAGKNTAARKMILLK